MKYLIQRNSDGQFLYGNKTFTFDMKAARQFDDIGSVDDHIQNWFNPEQVTVVSIND